MDWIIRKKADIGAIIFTPNTTEPRNAALDPAFGDFNLPLPDQHSPGATGTVMTIKQPSVGEVAGTPTNDYLKDLAANNPPAPEWFEGEEEDLF